MEKERKRRRLKARLIALGVALLTLAVAMGITLRLYDRATAAYLSFDLTAMIVINCIGALVMYLIVSYFLKKSIKNESESQ